MSNYDYPVRWLTNGMKANAHERDLCQESYESLEDKTTRYALGMKLMAEAHQKCVDVFSAALAECPPPSTSRGEHES